MSVSGFLGTRRLCLLLFTTSSCRTTAGSILSSSSQSVAFLGHAARSFASNVVAETCFTVSYLRKSCGLSLESAKRASMHLSFKRPENPDSVVNLLEEEGFTDANISKIIKAWPEVLVSNPKKRILPKLEFFRSFGCANADIATLFSRNTNFLKASLENCIIPCHDIIKSVVLSDLKAIKCFFSINHTNLSPEILAQNIRELRDHGVPNSCISLTLRHCLGILLQRPSKFSAILSEVKQMEFDPSKSYLVLAIKVLSQNSKLTVESKLDVLERFGLSRDDAWKAFRKEPMIMNFSKEKIVKVMDFLLNQMRWRSEDIVRYPHVFVWSLEKRTIPRCFVAHVLLSKGLEKEMKLSTLLSLTEENFVKRYVTSYQGTVPQLLDLYKGKVCLSDM